MDEKKAHLASLIADYWLPPAVHRRRFRDLSTVDFLRDYVSMSQPIVLTELPEHWRQG